jgi:RimJ/RimL family protein N-acetyltransferase
MHRRSAMRQAVLTTQRLHLRPRTMADLDACVAMDLDPDVHRFIYNQPPDPTERRAELRARITAGWPTTGGIWMVEWQDAPGFLGWCGLFPLEASGLIEIGYRYLPSTWGRGIATEAARAVLGHGFRSLAFDPIVAVTHPSNLASQHVLAKIGLSACGSAFYYGHWLRFFQLSRAAYLSVKPDPTESAAPPGPTRP